MYYKMKKQRIKNGLIIAFILSLAILATHHIYYKFKDERNIDYNSKSLDIIFHEKKGDKISIMKITPVTDSVGLSSTAYTLSIKNNLTEAVKYKLKLADDLETMIKEECGEYQIPKSIIRIAVKEDSKTTKIYSLSDIENNILDKGSIKALAEKNYTIRVWINNTSGLTTGSILHYHGILQVIEDGAGLAVK